MFALTDPELHEALTLPSTLPTVEIVEAKTTEYAEKAGFDEDTAGQISMVSREAAVNAVLHGNKQDPPQQVTASFRLTQDALIIQTADQGDGFDPAAIPDPLSPEGLLKPSGRGVFLM